VLEAAGVAVFALTGALVAARKGMDPFGFILLATVTGVGGGTLRDLLLGRTVFWVQPPRTSYSAASLRSFAGPSPTGVQARSTAGRQSAC
jgi:uncharacterized membrane protein YeiH